MELAFWGGKDHKYQKVVFSTFGDAFYYIDPKIIAVKKDGDWEIWYEPKIVAYSSSETIGTPSIIELLPANFCSFRSYPSLRVTLESPHNFW